MSRYTVTAWKKEYFLVTPDELAPILDGFHHVVTNTGVKRDYTESDPAAFLDGYRALYDRLAAGDKLLWARDYEIAGLHTGLTDHMENVIYTPTFRLSVPDFAEPCVGLGTFAVRAWKGSPLTKNWEVSLIPENILGLEAHFPSKALFDDGKIKMSEALADVTVWDTLLARVKHITKPLKVTDGDKIVNTRIRVSPAARADLPRFFFIRESGLTIQ